MQTVQKKVRCVHDGICAFFVTVHLHSETSLFLFFLTFYFLFSPFAFILSHSPLNLPMKSTLATSNYNEQLHMSASPASEIRRGCVAYTPNCIHKDTHTHTPSSTILSPSSQNNRLLPNSALIFTVNNTDILPPSTMKREGRRGRGGGGG